MCVSQTFSNQFNPIPTNTYSYVYINVYINNILYIDSHHMMMMSVVATVMVAVAVAGAEMEAVMIVILF